MSIPRPIHRSPLRLWLGRRYFILRRWWQWFFGPQQFARNMEAKTLPIRIFQHRSPLLRRLKDVEMYLQHNKVVNLGIAAKRIDGLVIRPGETFSFWYLVGTPSRWKGYKTGMMLRNGRVISGTGGGLCQLGNLLFWMSLHSPLTVTERWRHGYDVFPDVQRTQPFGSGATLSYNYVDLQIKNETSQDFQLRISLSEEYLEGGLYAEEALAESYQIVERNHRFVGEPWGGYSRHNEIVRQVYGSDTQKLLREEMIIENHAIMMYTPFLKAAE